MVISFIHNPMCSSYFFQEDPLEANFARIRWWHGLMESHVSKANMDHIDLVDRSFAPGDIVSSCLCASLKSSIKLGIYPP